MRSWSGSGALRLTVKLAPAGSPSVTLAWLLVIEMVVGTSFERALPRPTIPSRRADPTTIANATRTPSRSFTPMNVFSPTSDSQDPRRLPKPRAYDGHIVHPIPLDERLGFSRCSSRLRDLYSLFRAVSTGERRVERPSEW